MDDDPERQREGARTLEDVLKTWDCMAYYEANPRYNSHSPQFSMITAAIYAVGYQELEKARANFSRDRPMPDVPLVYQWPLVLKQG